MRRKLTRDLFAMELAIDAMAQLDANLTTCVCKTSFPAMPCLKVTGGEFDSGDYQEALRRAGTLIDLKPCAVGSVMK